MPTLDEYIAANFSEKQLNEYSHYSGWHETILDIVRQTWKAAQNAQQFDRCSGCGHTLAWCNCPETKELPNEF